MPLNEQEREWLERRKNPKNIDEWRYPCSNPLTYDRVADFIDAAKFEARVAIWLLDHDYEDVPCAHGMDIFCPRPRPPFLGNGCGKWCLLRCARLAVEQEMDDADRS